MGGIWHKLELINLPVKIIEKLCQCIGEECFISIKKGPTSGIGYIIYENFTNENTSTCTVYNTNVLWHEKSNLEMKGEKTDRIFFFFLLLTRRHSKDCRPICISWFLDSIYNRNPKNYPTPPTKWWRIWKMGNGTLITVHVYGFDNENKIVKIIFSFV